MGLQKNFSILIEQALTGNKNASEELILLTQQTLFTFCYHLTRNKQLSEDLTHDSFLKALNSLKDLKNREQFPAWLKKIARNLYLDYLKSAQIKNQVLVEEYEEIEATPSSTDSQIDAMKILKLLNEEDRTLLVLVDIQECSYSEAAEILGIPEGTVKSRLSRARDKFSDLYTNQIGTNKAI